MFVVNEMREKKYMSNIILKDSMYSLSNCEGVVDVEVGVDEDYIMYMLSGEVSEWDDEELIESGINEVIDLLRSNESEEDKKYNKELIVKFKEMFKERDVVRVVVWSIEYDLSVSVLCVN